MVDLLLAACMPNLVQSVIALGRGREANIKLMRANCTLVNKNGGDNVVMPRPIIRYIRIDGLGAQTQVPANH